MGQSVRLAMSVIVFALVAAVTTPAFAAHDQPPSTTAPQVTVVSVTVDPDPARLGRALRVSGQLAGVTAETTAELLLGEVSLGEVTVLPDGRFEVATLVPAEVPPGAHPLQLDMGGLVPLATVAVVESTGIDLSAALSSTLADDSPPVEDASEPVEEPPPPTAPPTTIAAAAPPPPPADRTTLAVTAAVAAALLLAAAATTARRRRRAEPEPGGTVVFKGGKAAPAEARGRDAAAVSSYRAAEHEKPAASGGGPPGKVTRLVDLSVEAGSAFEVVEITQWLSTSARQERVIARADALALARDVMRRAWGDHRPESRSEETWWEVRRTATAATLWIMHAGSDREFQVDEATRL